MAMLELDDSLSVQLDPPLDGVDIELLAVRLKLSKVLLLISQIPLNNTSSIHHISLASLFNNSICKWISVHESGISISILDFASSPVLVPPLE